MQLIDPKEPIIFTLLKIHAVRFSVIMCTGADWFGQEMSMNELQCPLDETAAVKIYIQAYLFFVATWWGKQ